MRTTVLCPVRLSHGLFRAVKSFRSHRFPDAHQCLPNPATEMAVTNVAAANIRGRAVKNASTFRSFQSRVSKGSGTKSSPQASKVQLIKMRHNALPGDPKEKQSTPMDQRVHLKFTTGEEESLIWFRKVIWVSWTVRPMIFDSCLQTVVVGRVIDFLQSIVREHDLRHHANTVSLLRPHLLLGWSFQRTQLVKIVSPLEVITLENSQPLGDQVEDGDEIALRWIEKS